MLWLLHAHAQFESSPPWPCCCATPRQQARTWRATALIARVSTSLGLLWTAPPRPTPAHLWDHQAAHSQCVQPECADACCAPGHSSTGHQLQHHRMTGLMERPEMHRHGHASCMHCRAAQNAVCSQRSFTLTATAGKLQLASRCWYTASHAAASPGCLRCGHPGMFSAL